MVYFNILCFIFFLNSNLTLLLFAEHFNFAKQIHYSIKFIPHIHLWDRYCHLALMPWWDRDQPWDATARLDWDLGLKFRMFDLGSSPLSSLPEKPFWFCLSSSLPLFLPTSVCLSFLVKIRTNPQAGLQVWLLPALSSHLWPAAIMVQADLPLPCGPSFLPLGTFA